jgi:hypothetical protein
MLDTTTPVGELPHGVPPRGLESTPSSRVFSGRFGRMFRNLPTYEVADASLVALGLSMIQELEDGALDKPLGEEDDDENTAQLPDGSLRLPAGYTYFGQFVDHDITFDPVSSLQRQDDPEALVDFRTPRFDLDSIYGRGPADQPYLYDDGVHLSLGKTVSDTTAFAGPDLLRVDTGRAVIGDPRNDENLIVSQLQSTMLRFHNAVLDRVGAEHPEWSKSDVFKLAQQQVRWHYQWIVIHDFLPRLVGQDVVDAILNPKSYLTSPELSGVAVKPDLRFYHWRQTPYMPVEFSVAAYRFGHSMIRPSYLINDVARTDPPVTGASRIPLFSQTGEERQSLNGFRPLPAEWGVEWKYFLPGINGHDAPGTPDGLPQPSYKIDAELAHPLGALPGSTASPELLVAGFDPSIAQGLAVRNLLRGKRLQLPSGQDVARTMGITPMTDDHLFGGSGLDQGVIADLAGRAPLWFYCLKEAEVLGAAAQLGPVGGRIVAEVLIGLLDGDPLSFLSVDPLWTPTLPAAQGSSFTLSDLINVAIPAPDAPQDPVYVG